MTKLLSIAVLTWLFLQTQLPPNSGQLLSAEYLDVKLPESSSCIRHAIYDEDDSIYFFECSTTKILKFSISSQTLAEIGSLPGPISWGITQPDSTGNIFVFGGGPASNEVYVFNPTTNTTTTVATLPYRATERISIKYNSTTNQVFILGGNEQRRYLESFNMETFNYILISTYLPFVVRGGSAIRVGNKAFIFYDYEFYNRQALELSLDTYAMAQVGQTTLPYFNSYSSAVWDGDFGYIFGGNGSN